MNQERESQAIHCQMTLDAIGSFVKAKPFGFNSSITGVFHRL